MIVKPITLLKQLINFLKYDGIKDQNDISFQLKLIFELGVIGVVFQLLSLLCFICSQIQRNY